MQSPWITFPMAEELRWGRWCSGREPCSGASPLEMTMFPIKLLKQPLNFSVACLKTYLSQRVGLKTIHCDIKFVAFLKEHQNIQVYSKVFFSFQQTVHFPHYTLHCLNIPSIQMTCLFLLFGRDKLLNHIVCRLMRSHSMESDFWFAKCLSSNCNNLSLIPCLFT